jgi:hypothetical protein
VTVLLARAPSPLNVTVITEDGGAAVLVPQPVSPVAFVLTFAQFFGISSQFGLPDYSGTIAPGAACPFPEVGPTSGALTPPTQLSPTTFQLPNAGVYHVQWQVPITEANAELGIALDGALLIAPVCVAGRAAAGAQVVGDFLFTTATPHVLSVINPVGAPAPLTVTPKAGGSNAVSATLLIQQIA